MNAALATVNGGPLVAGASFDWSPPAGLQDTARKIGFALIVLWLVVLLASIALPGRRFSANRLITPGKMIGLGFAVVILMDLNLVPTVVNAVITAFEWIWELFVGVF